MPHRSLSALRAIAIAVFAVAPSCMLSAQSAAEADRAFAAADWNTAAREYGAILQQDSTNQRARFRLGVSWFELQRLRESLVLFARTSAAGFQVVPSEFRQARAYARLGSVDSALRHLERAVEAGLAFEQVTTQSDLAPIRSDPRYAKLVRQLEDRRFPCRSLPEAHQLDFWVGEWTVTPWAAAANVPVAGRSRVSVQLEQCLVLEEWTPTDGPSGKSLNFWDTNRKQWRQVWVSADGKSLDYAGKLTAGEMRFEGWSLDDQGKRLEQRLTFSRVSADLVRQTFEESGDSGRTWKVVFDGRYTRVPATPTSTVGRP